MTAVAANDEDLVVMVVVEVVVVVFGMERRDASMNKTDGKCRREESFYSLIWGGPKKSES